MNIKQKVGCFFGLISIFVTLPIWYYLLFQILKAVNASEIMWILYWIYLPTALIINMLKDVAESIFDD